MGITKTRYTIYMLTGAIIAVALTIASCFIDNLEAIRPIYFAVYQFIIIARASSIIDASQRYRDIWVLFAIVVGFFGDAAFNVLFDQGFKVSALPLYILLYLIVGAVLFFGARRMHLGHDLADEGEGITRGTLPAKYQLLTQFEKARKGGYMKALGQLLVWFMLVINAFRGAFVPSPIGR